jgi:hypothetical protein
MTDAPTLEDGVNTLREDVDALADSIEELRNLIEEVRDSIPYTSKNADEVFQMMDIETDYIWREIGNASEAIRELYDHSELEQNYYVSYRR